MNAQRILSGIQPSGDLHIGNYLGALKQWVTLQNEHKDSYELLFCVVDLHAITVPYDPKELRKRSRELTGLYLAAGIDPTVSKIFLQSENPDHPYLAWVLSNSTSMGWLERMTQFKDKSAKQGERASVGLFNYPVLMAADILLYDTNLVPVGDDQKQHLELTSDIAEKFNSKYGETFTIPKIFNLPHTARVMSMQNPMAKMSKSLSDPAGTINMLDSADEIAKKIKRAVTDSGTEITAAVDKPAMTNLLGMYSGFTGATIEELEKKYASSSYSVFKDELAHVVVENLSEIQKKYAEISSDETLLDRVLDEGIEHARGLSSKKIQKVKELVGLSRSL